MSQPLLYPSQTFDEYLSELNLCAVRDVVFLELPQLSRGGGQEGGSRQ